MRAGNNTHIKCFCSTFAKRYKNYPYFKVELLNKTFLIIILIDAKYLSILNFPFSSSLFGTKLCLFVCCCRWLGMGSGSYLTFRPLALLIALRGLKTLRTLRILTTENCESLKKSIKHRTLLKEAITKLNNTLKFYRHLISQTYLRTIEITETDTTSKSRRLKALRQKEPLWRIRP